MKDIRRVITYFFALLLALSGCIADGSNDRLQANDPLKSDPTSLVYLSIDDIPQYESTAYVVINNNEPFFVDEEFTTSAFETYSELDSLGRCGIAYANICEDLMPTEPRGEIGMVKPSGWQTAKYDFVDGKYLYNRCHLIGFQLAGENANEKNLITGTRYMNVVGMLPFENMVADYVKETSNHVLYRVTPLYEGNNLVADGVLMEAESVEDSGEGVQFCVYCYNVQPGVEIDYATGNNHRSTENYFSQHEEQNSNTSTQMYVLNTNSMKFHLPDCSGANSMSENNRQEMSVSKDQIIAQGYEPCKMCNP